MNSIAKYFVASCVLLITVLLFPYSLSAQSEFNTTANVIYELKGEDTVVVTHNITIENVFTTIFTPSYTLSLNGIKPQNIKANSGENELPISLNSNTSGHTTITVDFLDPAIGRGQKIDFTIEFTDKSLVTTTGEITELTIPRIPEDSNFDDYNLELIVPVFVGSEAFISPEPSQRQSTLNKRSYQFTKDNLTKAGVVAAFGKFQTYSLDLSFHLENPIQRPETIEIAIPPDTAFQKMTYESIDPLPDDVTVDKDGNWIAKFKLKPREQVDVKVKAIAQVFSSPRALTKPTNEILKENLKPNEFWQSEDELVVNIAKNLKSPHEIYDYVVDNFTYNYARVQPNVKRKGAVDALKNPNNSICLEFTDAFITLARAAGIPAREANGYAYTENPTLQPLSLVADVLHSWPEYWDNDRAMWVPVDPTWGNTTGGVDYFNKLDLNHITFAYHGMSSTLPYPAGSYKLGSEPQKDVFVSLGNPSGNNFPKINLSLSELPRVDFRNLTFKTTLRNVGGVALYNQKLEVKADDMVISSKTFPAIPPFAVETMLIKTNSGLLARYAPTFVSANIGGETVGIHTNKPTIVLVQLTIFLLTIFIVIAASYFSVKKVKSHK